MLKNDVIIDKICRLYSISNRGRISWTNSIGATTHKFGGSFSHPSLWLKLRLVMWVLPRQPISMFGILNPSLCGRAVLASGGQTWRPIYLQMPKIPPSQVIIIQPSPDCQQTKVPFLVGFENAVLILMHEKKRQQVDFESPTSRCNGHAPLNAVVVFCTNILVSIFLLHVIWSSDMQYMKMMYFRGRNISIY